MYSGTVFIETQCTYRKSQTMLLDEASMSKVNVNKTAISSVAI